MKGLIKNYSVLIWIQVRDMFLARKDIEVIEETDEKNIRVRMCSGFEFRVTGQEAKKFLKDIGFNDK